jgi:hypothetical protein
MFCGDVACKQLGMYVKPLTQNVMAGEAVGVVGDGLHGHLCRAVLVPVSKLLPKMVQTTLLLFAMN